MLWLWISSVLMAIDVKFFTVNLFRVYVKAKTVLTLFELNIFVTV